MKYQTLEFNSQEYPDSLKEIYGGLDSPSLHFLGNLEILGDIGVGFCGSRKVSETGLGIARDCASQFAVSDIVVTSGYARGVDTVSHVSALAAGGRTLIVLAEGINKFRVKKDIREMWDWSRALVISQFEPDAIWRSDRAMERNKLIVGLSSATIVIEAGSKGGTLNAGLTALKMGRPLFVANYNTFEESNRGNEILLGEGGRPLNKNRDTKKADIELIIDTVMGRVPE